MNCASHQTVRLGRGRHSAPRYGTCVVELASMLAGESFTDRPRAVCPGFAAFLRGYNDAVGDERRQDLFEMASAAVGTRRYDGDTTVARIEVLIQYTIELSQFKPWWMRKPSFPDRMLGNSERAGCYCGRLGDRDDELHKRTLDFLRVQFDSPWPTLHVEAGVATPDDFFEPVLA